MNVQLPKSQIAFALTAAIASFIVFGQILHPGRALPVSAAPALDNAAANKAQAKAPVVQTVRLDAPAMDRPAARRGACRQDVQKLCGDVSPGQGRIIRCLAERRNEISEDCRNAMMQRRMDRQHQRQAMRPSQTDGAQARQNAGDWQQRQARRMQPSARVQSVPDTQP